MDVLKMVLVQQLADLLPKTLGLIFLFFICFFVPTYLTLVADPWLLCAHPDPWIHLLICQVFFATMSILYLYFWFIYICIYFQVCGLSLDLLPHSWQRNQGQATQDPAPKLSWQVSFHFLMFLYFPNLYYTLYVVQTYVLHICMQFSMVIYYSSYMFSQFISMQVITHLLALSPYKIGTQVTYRMSYFSFLGERAVSEYEWSIRQL